MNWEKLEDYNQLNNALETNEFVLVFKHSTRCSISSMALSRFEREWKDNEKVKCYYLDLLNYRTISNRIGEESKVTHQSPQVILWHNNQVIYHNSHHMIKANEIINLIN